MIKKTTKTVLMPIDVSSSNFCWDTRVACPHFENEGGHPNCNLDLDCEGKSLGLRYTKEGYVIKPHYCAMLKEEEKP